MDLKIKDVAELLNVSETTVRRWLKDGKIPAINSIINTDSAAAKWKTG